MYAHKALVATCAIASTSLEAKLRPNPSIEGMPKMLRLLCTPHVKR